MQHAQLLASVQEPVFVVNQDNDVQLEFDRFYDTMHQLLDIYYPERTVSLSSNDPPFITPAVKLMLRQKNRMMRASQINKADAIAVKIGAAIVRFNSTEMSRIYGTMDSKSMWAKVRELTGRNRLEDGQGQSNVVTAEILNHH